MNTHGRIESFETGAVECPACGNVNDCSSPVGHFAPPRAFDVSVCFSCGAISQWDDKMVISLVTEDRVQTAPFLTARKIRVKVRQFRGLPATVGK